MDSISSGKALFASIVTGVPTGIFAVITGESVSVAIGAGTAVLMFLFSMRNTANDQYIRQLNKQLADAAESQKADRESHIAELTKINMSLSDVQIQLHAFQTTIDQVKKQLGGHSCPMSADPSLTCRLPETLSSML